MTSNMNPTLREAMNKLGTVEIDENNKIKVNHPLYKINLIDPKYDKVTEYLQRMSSIEGNYKDSLVNRLPESPKQTSKTFTKKCEIDPLFRNSKEFGIFSKIAQEKMKKMENYENPNVRKQPKDHLSNMGMKRFTSDYGVNFNQNYKYYEDDTM